MTPGGAAPKFYQRGVRVDRRPENVWDKNAGKHSQDTPSKYCCTHTLPSALGRRNPPQRVPPGLPIRRPVHLPVAAWVFGRSLVAATTVRKRPHRHAQSRPQPRVLSDGVDTSAAAQTFSAPRAPPCCCSPAAVTPGALATENVRVFIAVAGRVAAAASGGGGATGCASAGQGDGGEPGAVQGPGRLGQARVALCGWTMRGRKGGSAEGRKGGWRTGEKPSVVRGSNVVERLGAACCTRDNHSR